MISFLASHAMVLDGGIFGPGVAQNVIDPAAWVEAIGGAPCSRSRPFLLDGR